MENSEWGIACPYGIGDTYYICGLARALVETHGGTKVAALVRPAHADIARMFHPHVGRVIVKEDLGVCQSLRSSPLRLGQLFFGHLSHKACWPRMRRMLGSGEMTILNAYKELLQVPRECLLCTPARLVADIDSATNKFEEMGLVRGHTVVLAPEATSIPRLPGSFWEVLAAELLKRGWTACTNVTPGTPAVLSTMRLECSLSQLFTIAELSGWFISLRNGLCDLLATAHCQLSVIYPRARWYGGTVLSATSLRKMGVSTAVREYETDVQIDPDELVSQIVRDAPLACVGAFQ